MQLPDSCFGRRWPVIIGAMCPGELDNFAYSTVALPEHAVLWEMTFSRQWIDLGVALMGIGIGLAIGDQLPTTIEQYNNQQPLFPYQGYTDGRAYMVGAQTIMRSMKFPVETAGRRLIAYFKNEATTATWMCVHTVWSSIPTEVPDWLISGQGRGL